jgi:hypothetical protein
VSRALRALSTADSSPHVQARCLFSGSGERRGLAHRLVPGQLDVVGRRFVAHAVAMGQLVAQRPASPIQACASW